MRHKRATTKLGRSPAHRKALVSSLVNSLIDRKRIRTTVDKAKLARSMADRMVTLAKRGTLAARRRAIACLRQESRVAQLFDQVAPACANRKGGYTRIVRLGRRTGDGAELVFLEWVDVAPAAPVKRKKKEAAEEPKAEGAAEAKKAE